MNKKDLVKKIAEELSANSDTKVTQKGVAEIVDAFIESVKESLVNGEKVSIAGFGVFDVVEQAARTARNPQTGGTVEVPAKNKPKFKAAKALKDAVN